MGSEQTQTDERNYTRRRFITASASPVARLLDGPRLR